MVYVYLFTVNYYLPLTVQGLQLFRQDPLAAISHFPSPRAVKYLIRTYGALSGCFSPPCACNFCSCTVDFTVRIKPTCCRTCWGMVISQHSKYCFSNCHILKGGGQKRQSSMNDSNTGLPVLTHPPGSLSKARVWKADPAGRTMDGAPVRTALSGYSSVGH